MKFLFLLLLVVPLVIFSQEKNIIHYHRFFVRQGTVLNFEKALIDHVGKYHTVKKWSVFKIMSGPDGGGYHVVEDPVSWGDIDS